ncbi:MAG TPA: hypothetical protein VIY49_03530 [Bryobacteraceae bacterium]
MPKEYFRVLAGWIAAAPLLLTGPGNLWAQNDSFSPNNLVVSRSVYAGNSSTVTVGQTLPPGCLTGTVTLPTTTTPPGTTTVKVTTGSSGCTAATYDGTYPTVFNNALVDGSFGITSPIFLDQMTTNGTVVGIITIPSNQIVTSFSSKSEVALNLSQDGSSITFVGYVGGPGCKPYFPLPGGGVADALSPTEANLLDVSNSNTPGVCDPTNPAVSSLSGLSGEGTAYYRSVAEVNELGSLVSITEDNAYSGNNGRAAVKALNGMYYLTGNGNNGGLSKTQLPETTLGVNLITSTGAELLVPGQTPPAVPPNINQIGDFSILQEGYTTADKGGKDNNFRGLRIFNNTLYVTKGSGGNGINTVYQVGCTGELPTVANASATCPPVRPQRC